MLKIISIVVPCLNEEFHIAACIESLLDNQTSDFKIEIIIVDGMSTDNTRKIVQHKQKYHSEIKLIENPHKKTPFALNLGVKNATGDYILIASAHSAFTKSYIQTLLNFQKQLNADVVGGMMKTDIKSNHSKTKAIKEVLSHRFGVGNSIFRVGASKPKLVDTVPFGLYKKTLFEEIGYYDERLIRNHDMELSKRFLAAGKTIYIIPDAVCTYYARETFSAIAKNNYNNGLWNILTVKYTHKMTSLSLRHFIPLCFILSLVVPLLLSFLYQPLLWITVWSASHYLGLLAIISARLAVRKKLHFFYLLWSFIVLHFSYGFGSLVGIFKHVKR
jgi:glycosyltransferase involved in cell wall biosynthesis